jgi:hypothetical protein
MDLTPGPAAVRPVSRATAILVRGATIGGVVALLALTGPTDRPSPSVATPAADPLARQAARLISAHDCSRHGLDGRIPATAVVVERDRTGVRRVRLARFDEAWAEHLRRPGSLLAVCP